MNTFPESISPKIWIRVAICIPYDDNHYITNFSIYISLINTSTNVQQIIPKFTDISF